MIDELKKSIETEIEYYEFPERKKALSYRQYDNAQFSNSRDRVISATQKLVHGS